MQTDIWLTEETSHPEQCPLCSKPLKKGSTTCFSCGFTSHPPAGSAVWIDPAVYGYPFYASRRQPSQAIQQTKGRDSGSLAKSKRQPNPITPIPLRASAQPANSVPGSVVLPHHGATNQKNRSSSKGKQQLEKTRGASPSLEEPSALESGQKASAFWQYESPDFKAASSLQALSLLVSEAPTQPQLESNSKTTGRLSGIDEIDTVPSLDEAHSIESSRAMVPLNSQPDVVASGRSDGGAVNVFASNESSPSSWTAGGAAQSSYAQLIATRSKRKKHRSTISFNLLDRVRWWLLHPGRIEFVLWLGGTVLLVCVTCVLLLVTAFSLALLTPGSAGTSSTNLAGTSKQAQQTTTQPTASGLALTRTDTGPLLPGQPIHLRGQGFGIHGHIRLMFDDTQPLLDQNGQSASTQADAHGAFFTAVWLNANLPWLPGTHFIFAHDLATNHVAKLAIILASGPTSTGGVSNTPVPSTSSGVTPIPSTGGSGAKPTPAGPTPVPTLPAGSPTVTPTAGTTPTVTPTVGTTPTVTPTVAATAGSTPIASPTASGSSNLGNALSHAGDLSLGKQLTALSPWVWLMVTCYSLSMVLLGLAGVLHKRHR
jgi:hypothetical protein